MLQIKNLISAILLAGTAGFVQASDYQTKFEQFLNNDKLPIFAADKKDRVETDTAKSKSRYYNDQIFIAVQINFDSGSSELSDDAKHIIDERVMRLQGNYLPTGQISIEGHSDHAETIVFGNELSQKRAQAVADYILKSAKRITEKDISVTGLGSDAPLLSGQSAEAKAQNRHVFIFSRGKAIPMSNKK